MGPPQREPWYYGRFARTTLPMFGFVVLCWYGLDQLMASKLKIRQTVRGYDKVEEYDPAEAMRRLERGGGGGGDGTGGGSGREGGARRAPRAPRGAAEEAAAARARAAVGGAKSLEEELEELTRGIDLRTFDYKPVPRTEDDG
ncbi:hypothetical protein Rsub_09797 [Raphidocelis subcapitata]|uniref:Uncharacterized protein n=1 Tax=Raphidocelis subcapitata TaxID=307507 RepID=A0A2V0PGG7_9CHLO|nr:hypothetical protein Rsub_09797 [Raphidocelis subcapitata]|eukprot:GBF97000.1 hypothetical protein Rsub_09797 [Raphidocelis subcapitata]